MSYGCTRPQVKASNESSLPFLQTKLPFCLLHSLTRVLRAAPRWGTAGSSNLYKVSSGANRPSRRLHPQEMLLPSAMAARGLPPKSQAPLSLPLGKAASSVPPSPSLYCQSSKKIPTERFQHCELEMPQPLAVSPRSPGCTAPHSAPEGRRARPGPAGDSDKLSLGTTLPPASTAWTQHRKEEDAGASQRSFIDCSCACAPCAPDNWFSSKGGFKEKLPPPAFALRTESKTFEPANKSSPMNTDKPFARQPHPG